MTILYLARHAPCYLNVVADMSEIQRCNNAYEAIGVGPQASATVLWQYYRTDRLNNTESSLL